MAKIFLSATAFALLVALTPVSTAAAQDATAASPESSGNTFWTQPALTGNWAGWRDRLADDGFSPFANWTGEVWDNANGGIRTGMTQDMLFNTGATLDLEKLVSWPGASFYAELHWEQGQKPVTNTGSFTDPSSLISANVLRAYSLYLKQTFFDNQLSFKGGQMGVDQDFYQTPSAAIFLNTGFTTPNTLFAQSLVNGDSSIGQYPVVAPGFMARYNPKSWPLYVEAGIYDGDPGPDIASNHGFGWKTGSAAGELAIGEAGWNYQLGVLPGTVAAGAFYHSGHFTNWDTGQTESGIYGFYGIIEQTLLQKATAAASSTPAPILTAFAFVGNAGPDSRVGPDNTYAAGLNWHAPLSSRPDDIAGVAFSYTGFSPAYTASAFNPNGPGVSTAAESVLEFTYEAALTPWFNLQPDAQIIFNPGNSRTRATATVVGLRVTVTF